MATYSGPEAWRAWRALDLPGIVKGELWAEGSTTRMSAEHGARTVALYTRIESFDPQNPMHGDPIVTHELEVMCAVMAAAIDELIAREKAAREAQEELAALCADPDWEDWRRERAREAGGAWGAAAYNDMMGY